MKWPFKKLRSNESFPLFSSVHRTAKAMITRNKTFSLSLSIFSFFPIDSLLRKFCVTLGDDDDNVLKKK